jgi:hypothetical protein
MALLVFITPFLIHELASNEEKEAEKPKPAEQGSMQQYLHHHHARHNEDRSRACHEEPQKDVASTEGDICK